MKSLQHHHLPLNNQKGGYPPCLHHGSHHPSTTTDKTNAATSFHFLWTGDGAALHFPAWSGSHLYNAAVRKVHATYANLIATQEVTGGVILGILLLHEIPSFTTVIGGGVTLIGIMSVLV